MNTTIETPAGELLDSILSGRTLSSDEAGALLRRLTEFDLDPVVAASALAGLRTRGETAEEVRAFAEGLRQLAVRPRIADVSGAVDVVGTGGDGSGSLNLSTGAALLAAAAGGRIIKHGNRSVSSQSGSYDVLCALGMDLPLDAHDAGQVYEKTGFTYLFAPAFHPAMKAVAPIRQAMAARTIFNLVGPLANPARVPHMVLGAFSRSTARMLAETLSGMDIERAYVIHGAGGWDEPTPAGPYDIHTVTRGRVTSAVEDPLDFGLARCELGELAGGDPDYNAAAIRDVFEGRHGAHRDALILGASLALRVSGTSVAQAVERAANALDDGSAAQLIDKLTIRLPETAGV